MRASTVFILALALLIGLAVAAGAKYFGLFGPKQPAPVAAPSEPPSVLVARVNLYEEVAVTADQVYVRPVQPQEEAKWRERYGNDWRDKLLPPSASAAHLRVALKNIPAESLLLRSDLTEAVLPDRLTAQLEAKMRPVNVAVAKDKAAGGVVRIGEYVDVFLTTKIRVGEREEMQTAPIARACKILMKRNTIWPLRAADPDNQPLNFTLQANLYRAALIDYAHAHGQLSLFPVSPPLKNANNTFSDPNSSEYAAEDQRIEELNDNKRTIGSEDLARIFRVVPPKPAAPPVAATPPLRITHIIDTRYSGSTTVTAPTPVPAPGAPATEENGPAPKGVGVEPRADTPAISFRK